MMSSARCVRCTPRSGSTSNDKEQGVVVRLGLMGATGMVGTEMLRILEERAFPVSEMRAYASARSEGRKLPFNGGEVTCEVLRPGCFDGLDLVIVDVDEPLSEEWAPQA